MQTDQSPVYCCHGNILTNNKISGTWSSTWLSILFVAALPLQLFSAWTALKSSSASSYLYCNIDWFMSFCIFLVFHCFSAWFITCLLWQLILILVATAKALAWLPDIFLKYFMANWLQLAKWYKNLKRNKIHFMAF